MELLSSFTIEFVRVVELLHLGKKLVVPLPPTPPPPIPDKFTELPLGKIDRVLPLNCKVCNSLLAELSEALMVEPLI